MRFFLSFILLISIVACKPIASVSNQQEKLLFSIEKGPCFGTCPQYKVEVYSDGSAYYYGYKNVNQIGEYKVILSKSVISQIKQDLNKSNLEKLDSTYVNKYLTDFPSIDLNFDLKQYQKHIHICHEQPPKEINELLHLIDSFEQAINWKNTN